MNNLKFISENEDGYRIGNYMVLFGSNNQRDLTNEFFTAKTDFESAYTRSGFLHLDWEHGLADDRHEPGRDDVLGFVDWKTAKVDDNGLFVERVLSRSARYAREILELIQAGVIGSSSEAVGRDVVKSADGEILRWPLMRDALTVTPAEPRMITENVLRTLKTLSADVPAVKTALGAIGGESIAGVGTNADTTKTIIKETNPMSDDTTTLTATSADDIAQIVLDKLADLPALKTIAPATDSISADTAKNFVKSFDFYLRTGETDAAVKAMSEGTPAAGGFLVPDLYANEIVEARNDLSIMRAAGARQISISGTDSFRVPSMTNSAAAVLTAENALFDEKEPTFGEIEFKPYKYTRITKVSDELLADSRFDVFGQILAPDVSNAFAQAENSAFGVGTGTAQPQGVVTGSSLGKTAASATAITADELIDLQHSLAAPYRQNAVWLMNDSTLAVIRKLKSAVSGDYLLQPGTSAGMPATLLGRPVYTLNTMPTIATGQKTVLFGDMSYFWIIDFGGVYAKRLDELYAANGQVGFRWYARFDSHVMLGSAIKHLIQA